jgi:23S rRNA (cytosine1962-C5)-methyltransferase
VPANAEKKGKVIPLTQRTFDIVVLDPPRWAKTPYGAIDVVRDYPSLLKPAIACTAKGGVVIATNHVPTVSREEFERTVRRTAEKMERPFASVEVVGPESDFPSFDGQPPLKVAFGIVA